MKISDLKLNNIAILGFGLEGKSTLAFLLKVGVQIENITIIDKNQLSEDFSCYHSLHGEDYLNHLGEFDIIFKSPGISPYHEKITPFRDKLYSNTELFFDNYDSKIIGVTATKGKSTTVTVLFHTLIEAGYNVKLVGNIGTPVLDEIDLLSEESYDYIIYELSSYMLETFAPKCFIGILGNIFPCHLDWHGNSLEHYKNAKLNILKNSTYKIINSDLIKDIPEELSHNIVTFGTFGDISYSQDIFYINDKEILRDENILLPGAHNRINITSIIAVLNIIGDIHILISHLQNVLNNFTGLPHRLENIGTYHGITFIDDGISVTPNSTIEAIKTYDQIIGTIILGGKDTGMDSHGYNKLKEQIALSNIDNIILLPETGYKIYPESKNLEQGNSKCITYKDKQITIYKTDNMNDVIDFAYKQTPIGKICLLSNAAQSYNLWNNYIEKGNDFKKEILRQSKKHS